MSDADNGGPRLTKEWNMPSVSVSGASGVDTGKHATGKGATDKCATCMHAFYGLFADLSKCIGH